MDLEYPVCYERTKYTNSCFDKMDFELKKWQFFTKLLTYITTHIRINYVFKYYGYTTNILTFIHLNQYYKLRLTFS